jgi:hypothetical protein
MPKIRVQALASDTDAGTTAHAVLTDYDAVSWFVEQVGQNQSEYELFKEDHPDGDVWDFIELHRGDLDTFSWEEVELEIPDV